MNHRFTRRWILLLWIGLLAWSAGRPAAAVAPLPAGPAVSQLVLHLMEESHYNHHALTQTESNQFLRLYIESYDYSHMFFTKSDVDGFETEYGSSLGDRVRMGDVSAAYAIFDRFMARLTERQSLVHQLTASTVTFTTNETMSIDWTHAPWPATPQEVRERWRKNVKYELLRARMDGQKPADQVKTVDAHYDNIIENYKEFDASDILQNFLSSLCHVYDPHSDYLAAPREENFNISMRLSLVGIGAQLRSEGGYTSIVSLIPGGPADVDKRLKSGDKIEAVAQGDDGDFLNVVGMKLDRLVQLIRGKKGTVVRIRVIPADAIDPSTRVAVRLVRDEIHLEDQEAKAQIVTIHPSKNSSRKVGVIRLPSFYADLQSDGTGRSTEEDVESLLNDLQKKGAEGLVLDLRDNGGGSLSEAVALTGLFIGKGPVVQVRDSQGRVTTLESKRDKPPYLGPMVVLTSRASASASEILAAALQDYDRAVIVGNKSTFGKGTVQSVIELDPYMPIFMRNSKAGAVHLTIQKFYRVSGGSTQNRGVIPDIAIPSIEDYMDIAESSLPNALAYDQIAPAAYNHLSLFPSRAALEASSAERVAESREFSYWREDIDTYRKRTKDKIVSLSETKLRADKAADDGTALRRKKERLEYGVPKEEIINITLEKPDGVAPPAPPAPSTDTAKGKDAGYEKAPPAPDVILEESMNVVADMITTEAPVAARDPAPAH